MQPVRRALSDITNTVSRSPRRVATTMARKEQTLFGVMHATTPEARRSVLNKAGIHPRHHSTYVGRYKKAVQTNETAERGVPRTAKRLSGAGRRTALTKEEEKQVYDWVMGMRRNGARIAVSEKRVQIEVRRLYGIKAGSRWVAGWMRRHGLTLRKRTTYKELLTERMQDIKLAYQNKCAVIFNTYRPQQIFNTDETSVFFDAPGCRTIDEVGAQSVEVGHSDHWADRISVALCVNYAGTLLPPLVVHRCTEKINLKKTGVFTKHYIETAKGGDTVPGVELWVTHKRTAWLDTEMMCRWLDTVYAQGVEYYGGKVNETVLFMDGCSAHHAPKAQKTAADLGIRVETLPPNCTPILQPCDQYVNSLFKKYYQEEWEQWYASVGYQDTTKPDDVHSNVRRAKEDEVNKWIANATARLIMATNAIRHCWYDTLIVSKNHIMHMAPRFWEAVRLMLQLSDLPAINMTIRHAQQHGANFNIPSTKRKRKLPPVESIHVQQESDKDEKCEAADVHTKEGVVVIMAGERYPAMVDIAVVSALRQKRKRRRVDVSKENVKPQKRARRPESRPPERPFQIKQAWET